jgi:peptidoglycan/xylan/chitin deacetylase (PgdA/CDA1 family)
MFEGGSLPRPYLAMALKRNPEAVAAFQQLGHEIACHGLRWISYQNMDETTGANTCDVAVQIIRRLTGAAPQERFTGRDSPIRKLVVEWRFSLYEGAIPGDDLPFWDKVAPTDAADADRAAHLIVPTPGHGTLCAAAMQGFNSGCAVFDSEGYLRCAICR